jgi:hypothetical protein
VNLRGSKTEMFYYFSADIREESISRLPEGLVVVENESNGFPVLVKADQHEPTP